MNQVFPFIKSKNRNKEVNLTLPFKIKRYVTTALTADTDLVLISGVACFRILAFINFISVPVYALFTLILNHANHQ